MDVGTVPPQQRSKLELVLLNQFFSGLTASSRTNGTAFYPASIDIPVTTNSGRRYTLRLIIPPAYPDVMPDMLVANPRPLMDRSGSPLLTVDPDMHVIGSEDGCTSLCHFNPSLWEADFSLHMVAMKGRIWLEAYEGHLQSGETIDHWLPHMTESRIPPARPGLTSVTTPAHPAAPQRPATPPPPPPPRVAQPAPVAAPSLGQRVASALRRLFG